MINNPLDRQVGGNHYKGKGIQPVEFFEANGVPYCIANAIKYLFRHRAKGGRKDVEKALHYIELAQSFFEKDGSPFPKLMFWGIYPNEFTESNGIDGQERDAIHSLCAVPEIGIEGYRLAHACVKYILDHEYK